MTRALTAGQLGIWQAQQLAPDNPAYNLGEYLEIQGPLDVELFVAAVRRTLSEVDGYRLRFVIENGLPQQRLDPAEVFAVELVDVGQHPDPRRAAEAWMRADLSRPADLVHGPLFTCAVLTLEPNRFIWYHRVHHIALDGHGALLIADRVAQWYAALTAGDTPVEPAPEPVELLREADEKYRASTEFEQDREFWRERFADRTPGPGPAGPRVRTLPDTPVRHAEDLGPHRSSELRATARRLRTSLAALVIAAAAIHEHRLTGAEDVVLAVPVRGRVGRRELKVPAVFSLLSSVAGRRPTLLS